MVHEINNTRFDETHGKVNDEQLDKAAVLLLTLENSSPGLITKVISILGEEKAKVLLERVSKIGKISTEKRNDAVRNFYGVALEKQYLFGGMDVSSKILKESFGISKAKEFFKHKKEKFRFFEDISSNELYGFLKTETDQMKLFIFNFLSPRKASELLGLFEDDSLALKLMHSIQIPNMDLLYDFELELATHFNTLSEENFSGNSEYITKLAATMEFLPEPKRNKMLDQFKESDESFATELRSLIFIFEDFLKLTDQIFQSILFEISDFRLIAIAMLNTSEELVDKMNDCLTSRTKDIVESESLGIEKKLNEKDIEEAKRKIVAHARKMEKKGEISLDYD